MSVSALAALSIAFAVLPGPTPLAPPDPFAAAIGHHRRGEFEKARSLLAARLAALQTTPAGRAPGASTATAVSAVGPARKPPGELPYVHLYLGLSLCRLGREAEGLDHLRQAARLAPEDAEVQHHLSHELSDQGRLPEATEAIAAALALRPDWTEAALDEVRLQVRAGRRADALARLQRLLVLDPLESGVHLEHGITLLGGSRGEDATTAFKEAIRLRPDDPAGRFWLGLAFGATGRQKEAQSEIADALAAEPGLASSPELEGMPAACRQLVDQAMAARERPAGPTRPRPDRRPAAPRAPPGAGAPGAPASTPLPHAPPTAASRHLPGGGASEGRAGPGTASELASLLRSGSSAQDAGDPDEAAAIYARAVALSPDSVEAQLGLGIAQYNKGDRDVAIATLTRLLPLAPRNVEVHYHLGLAYGEKGEHEQAISRYREAARLSPGDPRALVGLGISLSEKGLHDEAIATYREAIGSRPAYPEAHYNLGVSLSSKQQDREAIRSLKEAIRLDPTYADPHFTLGVIYHNLEMNADALREYQVLRDLDEGLAHELYKTIYPD
jgi:tetratricopeptide (TPR) repeat protein